MNEQATGDGAGDKTADDIAALELMARAMVGLTMKSVDVLGGEVTLPQFRLLLVLSGLGRVPSSRLAAEMGTGASSVTRLADRLEAVGLVVRGTDPRSRSVVTVEVTRAGVELVARVVARRRELLSAVLRQLLPADQEQAVRVARKFAALAADAAALSATSPLPL
jgi:DNA-binding MarR family transcriptional regulator